MGEFEPSQRAAMGAVAAGEGLRDAVEFALHGGGEGGQPFVVHHERLDAVLGKLGIFGVQFGVQVFLRGFEFGSGVRLLVEQFGVVFQCLSFIGVIRVFADFLEAGLHGFGCYLLLLTIALDDVRE